MMSCVIRLYKKSFRHMMIMKISRLQRLQESRGRAINELSSSGMYDESGLSMNHFLKIRDYLTKEELLK